MSTQKNDGGPAFPHHETTSTGEPFHDHLGMTLRDYFAGQALAAMAKQGDYSLGDWQRGEPEKDANRTAQAAFLLADAMLKAREGKQ